MRNAAIAARMTMLKLLLVAAGAALAGCATAVPDGGYMFPVEAIARANAAAPSGVPGRFALRVRASGRQSGMVYLNSEDDYRDQRNLTVAIAPPAQRMFAELNGPAFEKTFEGKDILVTGVARRVRIDFIANGRRTGKYYYQTHVAVTDADQIGVAQ